MLKLLKSLFSNSVDPEVQEVLDSGAQIIDVRTPREFQSGHVPGSKNIPLSEIEGAVGKFKKTTKPVVLCCASGNRSGQAVQILKSKGVENIYNGGSWRNLR